MDKPKRASGGKRATAAKKQREAALLEANAGWNEADRRLFARLKRHPQGAAGAHAEAIETLQLALRRCRQNPALTPQQRHEQICRLGLALVKAADPGRLIEEQAALLARADQRIESLEMRLRGTSKPPGDRGQPSSSPLQ